MAAGFGSTAVSVVANRSSVFVTATEDSFSQSARTEAAEHLLEENTNLTAKISSVELIHCLTDFSLYYFHMKFSLPGKSERLEKPV